MDIINDLQKKKKEYSIWEKNTSKNPTFMKKYIGQIVDNFYTDI